MTDKNNAYKGVQELQLAGKSFDATLSYATSLLGADNDLTLGSDSSNDLTSTFRIS